MSILPSLLFCDAASTRPPCTPTQSPSPPPAIKNSRTLAGRTEKTAGNVVMQRHGRLILMSAKAVADTGASCLRGGGSSHMVLPAHAQSRVLCNSAKLASHIQHTSCVTPHLSHITYHTSHITHHTSHITCKSASLMEYTRGGGGGGGR